MNFDLLLTRAIRLGGFTGAMYEVFVNNLERPALLALLGAMMAVADGLDRKRKDRE